MKYNKIVYSDSRSDLDPSDYPKLIGELILIDKLQKVNVLLSTEQEFKSKIDCVSLLSKSSTDYINVIDDLYVVTKLMKLMAIPEFLALNHIGYGLDLNMYIKTQVEVIDLGNKSLIN